MGEQETKKRKRKRSKKSQSSSEDALKTEEDARVAEEAVVTETETSTTVQEADGKEGDHSKHTDGDDLKKRKRKRKRKNQPSSEQESSNEPSASDAAKLQSVEHTVFIEGLPFTASEDGVRSFFVGLGCKDILELRLPRWQDSGRLRGFGHVVFASTDARAHALSDEVNGKELGGRYITVKEAKAPRAGTTAGAVLGGTARPQPKGCKVVHIRNLPYDATEDQILEVFRTCGKIVEGGVRIARNHVNGQSKGFGYVEYKNEEAAFAVVQRAAKPFGLTVSKRPVFVDYDEGSMKGSFRGGDGKLWSKEHGGGGGQDKSGRPNNGPTY